MRKSIPIVSVVALAAVSCSHGVSHIQTRPLTSPNPTSYSFPMSVEEVHQGALQAFSGEHQRKQRIFEKAVTTVSLESVLEVEDATNALVAKDVFADPANARDLFLRAGHLPFTASPVYRGGDRGLPFYANFHVHLASQGTGTVVTVTASETGIVNGTKFGFGPCGPGQGWNEVRVAPTTVEEYRILSYLGSYLGITNMPAVILPGQ